MSADVCSCGHHRMFHRDIPRNGGDPTVKYGGACKESTHLGPCICECYSAKDKR